MPAGGLATVRGAPGSPLGTPALDGTTGATTGAIDGTTGAIDGTSGAGGLPDLLSPFDIVYLTAVGRSEWPASLTFSLSCIER